MRRVVLLAGVGLEAAIGAAGALLLGEIDLVLYLMGCAGALAGLIVFAVLQIASGGRDDNEDGGEGRGGGPRDEPPPWWPDFERDFWRYARERERITT